MNAANWISLGSFVAATVSAAVAVVQAKRASASKGAAEKHEARAEQYAGRATKAAEEAAAWQRQAAEAAQRSADALEAQNRLVEDQAEEAEGVPWEIRFREGSLFDVWNITNTTKFGVRIEGGGVQRPKSVDRIDGRSSVDFFGTSHMGGSDQVEVTWHRREDLSDEPRQWRGNKPPKL
ncbi:hypothetical protein [Mycobacterium sp. 852014-50255_SCH5639931]|uniref:hypothetical protein n=1 Tax=Mycobacterium sp. 852014-50255_SCH5639931 TaxID=1834112 RepID=UPI0007FD4460|nr:hypothetical protein [Mycobacterium sp. 852014-50255_SCH5639931]OBB65152.1 hypothetical protein A5758_18585 [Mycobacterium sp. 852014-50255_SCH5639931]